MKNKIFFSCLLAAGMLSVSCSDFLTEDPKGQMEPSTYLTSTEAIDGAVYALYAQVNRSQIYTNMLYPQWQGDDMTANPGSNKQAVAELDGFSASNNNKGVKDAWTYHYKIITAANNIINNVPGAEGMVSQDEINIAMGQAKFWRAYAYYYLVRLFGPLPIVNESTTEYNQTPTSSVADVYALIEQELTEILEEDLLPTSYSTEPRHHDGVDAYVTKQATQAMLAAVYMSEAGYPLYKEGYYAKAAEMAKAVIDGNSEYGFYLDPTWSHVYSMGHNYNKETVLGIDFSPVVDWASDSEFTSCNRFEGLGDGGWGDAWGEIKFWKNFPEGARKNAVYAPKVTFEDSNGNIINTVDWWELDENGNAIVAAYHPMFSVFTTNADASGNELAQPYDYTQRNYRGMCNGHRHRVIRYSEVLLWYAESAARSGASDLSLAKECLKQVRERACDDPDNVTLSDGTVVAIDAMTADQLAEACYIEHGWEVAGYWVALVTRRSDEFRMNKLKENFDFRVQNPEQEIVSGITAKESVSVTNSTWNGDEGAVEN